MHLIFFRQQSGEASDVSGRCEQVERLRRAEQALRQRKLVQRQMRQLHQQQLSREVHASQCQTKPHTATIESRSHALHPSSCERLRKRRCFADRDLDAVVMTQEPAILSHLQRELR